MRETLPTLRPARRDTSTASKARDIRAVENFKLNINLDTPKNLCQTNKHRPRKRRQRQSPIRRKPGADSNQAYGSATSTCVGSFNRTTRLTTATIPFSRRRLNEPSGSGKN